MARSLDQLFEFILGEIALEGEQGVTVKDIVQYVRKFYDGPISPSSSTLSQVNITKPPIDRSFVSRLWRWLSRHDDISIGEDNEYNDLSLDEVEIEFPGILVDADLSTSQSTVSGDNTLFQQNRASQAEDGPRIYASEELVYYAIAGHAPDSTRVFASEYTLLCRIAAARYDGILQGTLRQVTGQDKRSVPKRTDSLHAKGYIVKRTVFTGGHKTSRLFLRRFAYSYPTSDTGQVHTIRLRDIALHIFSTLRDNSLLTQEDIALHLGISDAPQIRVLVQILRHFVRKGCMRKVKSAFAPGSKAGDLKLCFQILRELSNEDWLMDEIVALDLDTPLDDAVAAAKEKGDEAEVEVPDEAHLVRQQAQGKSHTAASHQRPVWNPDRLLSNVLCDFVSASGDAGVTNLKARQHITGVFVRRPLESLLVRLSHLALKAQPAAVKEIAIVRRHELDNGISHYVHRTLNIYHEMVRQGMAEWSSIQGGEAFSEQLNRTLHGELSELFREDKYGIIERLPPKDQIQAGAIALEDLISSVHAATYTVRKGDMCLIKASSGQLGLSNRGSRCQARSTTSRASFPFIHEIPENSVNTSKGHQKRRFHLQGRQRKFVEGTREFWTEIFFAIRQAQDPTFPRSGTGYMNDPAALSCFEARPPSMDTFILQSLQSQLPLPSQPQDISQLWLDEMHTFLDRTRTGAYCSPTGMRDCKRPPVKSKLLVIRSGRFNEIDFSDRRQPPAVLLFSSSNAHSQRYYRFAQWWNKISDSRLNEIVLPVASPQIVSKPPQKSRKPSTPAPMVATPVNKAPASRQAPIRGVFRDSAVTPIPASASNSNGAPSKLRALDSSVYDGSDTDATVTDKELVQREAQARRRRRTKSSTTKSTQESTISSLPASGRSGRRRKLTRKAIEIAQIQTPDPASNISSPTTNPENNTEDQDNTLTALKPPRLTIIPTPDSSRHGSPRIVTPTTKKPGREAEKPSGEIHDLIFSTHKASARRPRGPSKSCIVVLHISPAKLARVSSSYHSTQPEERHPPLDKTTTVSNPSEPEPRNTQFEPDCLITAELGIQDTPHDSVTENLEGSVDEISQFVPQPQPSQVISPGSLEADSLIQQQTFDPVSAPVEQDMREASYHSGRNSRATSISVASSHDNEINSSTVSDLPAKIKRQTHRVVKDSNVVSPAKSRSLFKISTSKFHESRHATRYYRMFIMDLVRMCNGVVPHQPSTLKRVMIPKCIEANIDPNANIKNMKKQVDQLVSTNQLKIMGFAFQRNGMSYTKKILALPSIQRTDTQFIEMRDKITALPFEDDYVPPELQAESLRQPSGATRHEFSDQASSEEEIASTPKRKKTQPTVTPRRKASAKPVASRLSFTPEPQAPPPNTGFLTLKVSKEKLQSLDIGPAFTSNYFRLPAVPLQFEADAEKAKSATAVPTPVSQRRSGVRIPRNTKFNSGTRKIQWGTPKLTPLPRTIKAILTQERPKSDGNGSMGNESAWEGFQTEVDLVSSWEQRKWNDLQEPKPGEWIFIKHTTPREVFPAINVDEDTLFKTIGFNQDGEEVENEAPPVVSWEVFVDALVKTKTKRSKAVAYLEQRKRKFDEIDGPDNDEDVSDYEGETAQDNSSRTTSENKKRKMVGSKKARKKHKVRSEVRGIGMRYLSTEQIHRLSVAIVVVRTLLGGLERHVDLNLLARIYTDEPITVLRERWKVIRTRCIGDIDMLAQDFQVKYLDALADEKVPSVNFDDFENTDWEGILKWAVLNISKEGGKDLAYEIPPTRDELFELNDLEVEESAPVRNLFTHTVVFAVPSREDARCSIIFGDTPKTVTTAKSDTIVPKFPHEDDEQNMMFTRARSWVLAAILTPSQGFDPAKAHAKLLKLASTKTGCEKLVDSTLRKLQADKFVVKANNSDAEIMVDGQTYSGTHGWKICSKFFDRLDSQRLVSREMLRRAAKFKIDMMDPAFLKHGIMSIEKDVDIQDGDMVAILNLLSVGSVRVKPGSDIPASRYGVDWERQEYKTKSMDKNLLAFTAVIEPTSTYVYGDALAKTRQTVPVPRGGIDQADEMGLIPIWFDIHHKFRPEIWEIVISAVVGLVSVRPGISDVEIARMSGWAVLLRDVGLVLQFLFDCQCVQRVHGGWETTEGWWFAIGTGHENGVIWNHGSNA